MPPTPYYEDDNVTLYCGRCEDVLPTLDTSSIDLVLTDPPYYRVKGEAWDRQWDTPALFLAWVSALCEEWQRILRPNGSLYVFASPRMAARVEVAIAERFNVVNHLVWQKELDRGRAAASCKEILRGFFPNTERIIFAEHYGADNMAKGEAGYEAKCDELRGFVFEPLRSYIVTECNMAGVTPKAIAAALGVTHTMIAQHYFSASQWHMPTEKAYCAMQALCNPHLSREYGYLRREYEDLRREYEDLRREYEDLRRPFAVTADVPYTDVWNFPTVGAYPGKHPCEKPLSMMEHIVRTSSRPGALVLDCCAGSGATLVAAQRLGRRAVGIEMDERWCKIAATRLQQRTFSLLEAA